MFLLSGGGKFNYQGTKKWIEDNMEAAGRLSDYDRSSLFSVCKPSFYAHHFLWSLILGYVQHFTSVGLSMNAILVL